jgi:hypothetical protein
MGEMGPARRLFALCHFSVFQRLTTPNLERIKPPSSTASASDGVGEKGGTPPLFFLILKRKAG